MHVKCHMSFYEQYRFCNRQIEKKNQNSNVSDLIMYNKFENK
jgi:hypothetical protein